MLLEKGEAKVYTLFSSKNNICFSLISETTIAYDFETKKN